MRELKDCKKCWLFEPVWPGLNYAAIRIRMWLATVIRLAITCCRSTSCLLLTARLAELTVGKKKSVSASSTNMQELCNNEQLDGEMIEPDAVGQSNLVSVSVYPLICGINIRFRQSALLSVISISMQSTFLYLSL